MSVVDNTRPGRLTTHVLDTMNGHPASGMRIDLKRLAPEPGETVTFVTNHDGRVDTPLLEGAEFSAGSYELTFHVGSYFAGHEASGAGSFIDLVPVRFVIADEGAHYHVPLLVSPFAYSTYRGS